MVTLDRDTRISPATVASSQTARCGQLLFHVSIDSA
jgi:hypothetical protein